jgi:hypothetical protein
MTVVVPPVPTFASGEKLTVAGMTTKVADPLTWLMNPPNAKCRNSALSVASSATVWVLAALDAEDYDWTVEAMHDVTSFNSRIYFPANGLYELMIYGAWSNPSGTPTGHRELMIRANAAGSSAGGSSAFIHSMNQAAGTGTPVNGGTQFGTWRTRRTAGEYVEAFARQNQAETLTVAIYLGAAWVSL